MTTIIIIKNICSFLAVVCGILFVAAYFHMIECKLDKIIKHLNIPEEEDDHE